MNSAPARVPRTSVAAALSNVRQTVSTVVLMVAMGVSPVTRDMCPNTAPSPSTSIGRPSVTTSTAP